MQENTDRKSRSDTSLGLNVAFNLPFCVFKKLSNTEAELKKSVAQFYPETYSEPCETSKLECFTKIGTAFSHKLIS